MKIIPHNGFTLVGNLPDDANTFSIGNATGALCYKSKVAQKSLVTDEHTSSLPPGNCSIVGLAKDLTREQKLEIEPKGTAAFNRLLDDNGLKDSTTLILKKI